MNSFEPRVPTFDDQRVPFEVRTDQRGELFAGADVVDPADLHPAQPFCIGGSGKHLWRNLRTALPLALCDQCGMFLAIWLANVFVQLTGMPSPAIPSAIALSLAGGLLVAFAWNGLYPGVALSAGAEMVRCWRALSGMFAFFLLAAVAFQASWQVVIALIAAAVLSGCLVPVGRRAARTLFGRFRWWRQPVLIFGDGTESRALWQRLDSHPQLGLNPVGILGDLHRHWNRNDHATEPGIFLGPPAVAPEVSRHHRVDRAIVMMPAHPVAEFYETLNLCAQYFPHITIVPEASRWNLLVGDGRGAHQGEVTWECRSRLLAPTPRLLKRTIDVAVVLMTGWAAVPLMLVVAAAIKCTSRGPVFFAQERIGRGGKSFRLWKFRTMFVDAERILHDYLQQRPELREQWEAECKIEDDPRIVPWIGRFLRKSSLDELPQLWNVLKGEMSLVGPRPLPLYHLDQFEPQFRHLRATVTPGITGLWQIASRSDGRPEMFARFDTEYIRNWSLLLDLSILLRTVKVVVLGTGAC